MQGKQETFASYSSPLVAADAASINGIIDFVSWYNDEPSLKFAQPGVPIHQRPDLPLSELVGMEIRVTISEEQFCTQCGEPTDTSPCPSCAGDPPHTTCVMHPATHCEYQRCPYPEYKQRSCSHTHLVYLAATDRIKVGISRESRARCRWAEQGASHAIPIARAPNRKAAGIIEKAIGEEWPQRRRHEWYQPMEDSVDRLTDDALATAALIPEKLQPCYFWDDSDRQDVRDAVVGVPSIEAPALDQRLTTNQYSLSTGESREGRVLGIRGGLLATDSFVANLKSHSSHVLTIETEDPFFKDTDLRVKQSKEGQSQEPEQPPEYIPASKEGAV